MDNEQQHTAREDGAVIADGDNPTTHRITDDIRERMASLQPNAAEGVEHAADAAREAARSLRDQEAWLARMIGQGADRLSEFAGTLRTNEPQALLGKAEEFARRQPVLFTGAAMAIGFALARAAAAAARSGVGQPSEEVSRVRD
jgi:ElaB/YqjD/DUF883 family membrane-anchored ribosome-binding protein